MYINLSVGGNMIPGLIPVKLRFPKVCWKALLQSQNGYSPSYRCG